MWCYKKNFLAGLVKSVRLSGGGAVGRFWALVATEVIGVFVVDVVGVAVVKPLCLCCPWPRLNFA